MATSSEVVATDGSVVRAEAASLCVHGDTDGAVQVARAVRAVLEEAGVAVSPFTKSAG
jgi:UPF0271 protein